MMPTATSRMTAAHLFLASVISPYELFRIVTTVKRLDVWWWLSTPYGVLGPVVLICFHLREGAGESLAVFLLVSILCTCSAVVWSSVTIIRRRPLIS